MQISFISSKPLLSSEVAEAHNGQVVNAGLLEHCFLQTG